MPPSAPCTHRTQGVSFSLTLLFRRSMRASIGIKAMERVLAGDGARAPGGGPSGEQVWANGPVLRAWIKPRGRYALRRGRRPDTRGLPDGESSAWRCRRPVGVAIPASKPMARRDSLNTSCPHRDYLAGAYSGSSGQRADTSVGTYLDPYRVSRCDRGYTIPPVPGDALYYSTGNSPRVRHLLRRCRSEWVQGHHQDAGLPERLLPAPEGRG